MLGETAHAFKVSTAVGGYRLRQSGMDETVKVLTPRQAELYALMPEKLPPDTSNFFFAPCLGLW